MKDHSLISRQNFIPIDKFYDEFENRSYVLRHKPKSKAKIKLEFRFYLSNDKVLTFLITEQLCVFQMLVQNDGIQYCAKNSFKININLQYKLQI